MKVVSPLEPASRAKSVYTLGYSERGKTGPTKGIFATSWPVSKDKGAKKIRPIQAETKECCERGIRTSITSTDLLREERIDIQWASPCPLLSRSFPVSLPSGGGKGAFCTPECRDADLRCDLMKGEQGCVFCLQAAGCCLCLQLRHVHSEGRLGRRHQII